MLHGRSGLPRWISDGKRGKRRRRSGRSTRSSGVSGGIRIRSARRRLWRVMRKRGRDGDRDGAGRGINGEVFWLDGNMQGYRRLRWSLRLPSSTSEASIWLSRSNLLRHPDIIASITYHFDHLRLHRLLVRIGPLQHTTAHSLPAGNPRRTLSGHVAWWSSSLRQHCFFIRWAW